MASEVTASARIVDCVAYVPSGRLDLRDRMAELGVSEEFLTSKTGYLRLARKAEEEDTADLAAEVVGRALRRHPEAARELGVLVVVTQTPDGGGIPHVSSIVHGRLGLPDGVAAFDISLGCSGWVYALSVVKSFMDANSMNYGLLVTADPYSKILDPADRGTVCLFGDAATATLLTPDQGWTIGRFVFGTDGTHAEKLMVDDRGKLHMNGRGIFTFSAVRVPECIEQTLAANDVKLEDVDRILLHQASRYIVETIGQRIGAPDKTPFVANDIGNTVSSSIPLLLDDGICDGDSVVLVCGFGVGLSWAATVLRDSKKHVVE